jgi:hypothetical protein
MKTYSDFVSNNGDGAHTGFHASKKKTSCRFVWLPRIAANEGAILIALRSVLSVLLLGIGLVMPFTLNAQTCVQNTTSDWMTTKMTSDPLAQDIRPHDCAVVQQTPPDFRWPDVLTSGGYSLTLTYPDGHTKVLAATQNWRNWDEILTAGTYSWTVGYTGGANSVGRKFIVDANSKSFLVPSISTLLSTVVAKSHPRSLPDATTFALMKTQRAAAVSSLLSGVSRYINQTLPSQGASADDAYSYSDRAMFSLQACVYSNQDTYCNDALRRVVNLAAWDPKGATSYLKNGVINYSTDMSARWLTWTIATGYDWLYPRLSSAQRTQILNTVRVRNGDMYNDIIGTRSRIAQRPRDSHANQTLTFVALISTLMAGDLAESTTWMPGVLPLALNAINPWGDEEGGFANSETQGLWDVGEMLPVLTQFRYLTGIDLAKKPWVRNWGNFLTYFTPPGMLSGASAGTSVFGDGFEYNQAEYQARSGKGYTYFSPTPLGRWHASMLSAEDPTRLEYLMSPPADFTGTQAFPSGTSNALYLSSIGQVAMHSDLSNLARTSVYFKSSPPPYGAYNHGHADQNSFVVNAGGQRLAIESGYYDLYNGAHWLNWYHTTKAKNAITYDGGLGQLFWEKDGKMGYGRVTSFSNTPSADIVTGDATAAYGGALSKAQRSIVYLRPNLILVYDNLASATSRQWEWNIHALNQMTVTSDTQIALQNSGQSLCIKMLAGPTLRFSQTNQFSAAPSGSRAAQWHGNFYSTTRLPSTEFVALLNVGCTTVTASASKTDGAWTIPVGDKTVRISASGVVTVGAVAQTPEPYSGTPAAIPGTFEAENFDRGGEGIAYHDTTTGNQGSQYRPSENVDIIASTDALGGGYVVNNMATGEWLLYTINVASAGKYTVELRASQNLTDSVAFHVEIDGVPLTGSVLIPNTGNWNTFQWVSTPSLSLTAGKHLLKIVTDQQYFNLNTIRLLAEVPPPAPTSTPYTGTPITVPGTFEVENFDLGGEGLAYHDTTKGNQGGLYRPNEDVDIVASADALGGGFVVNNFTTGEWLAYTINVIAGGRYNFGLRASQNYVDNAAFHVEIDGVPVTGPVLIPNTGSWNTFQWVNSPSVSLASGKHLMKIFADTQYFNLNSLRVTTAP